MTRGYLGLYKEDLPVDYAEAFMEQFLAKTGDRLILIVEAQFATEELVNKVRLALMEDVE